jgi:hypothetical protein
MCDKYVVGSGGSDHQEVSSSGRYNTASGIASAAAGAAGREKFGVVVSSNQNLKPPIGMDNGNGVKPVVKKLLPNRLCYPAAFRNWKRGMRVPKCRRCDANLQPEENHVCEGYVPKYATMDMEMREANREALLGDRWDRSNDRKIAMDTFDAEEIE